MGGWVYFMTNRRNGTLYAGVTSDLPRRKVRLIHAMNPEWKDLYDELF